MPWIRMTSEDEAEEELRELFDRSRDPETGQLDHILQIHSLHPQGLRAHLDLYSAVMAGTKSLRKVEREMIALHVSRLNECHY